MLLKLDVCKTDEDLTEAVLTEMFNKDSKGYVLAVQTDKGNCWVLNSIGSEAIKERIVKDYIMELDEELGEEGANRKIEEWRDEGYI